MMKIKLTIVLSVFLCSVNFAQTFTNYTSADGLLADNVNCIDAYDGYLWFGTQNGLITLRVSMTSSLPQNRQCMPNISLPAHQTLWIFC